MSCLAPAAEIDCRTSANSWVWLSVMVLFWGLSWPATQMALVEIPPLWLAAFRFGSAALCLFGFLALRGALALPRRGDLPIVFSIGLLQMMTFTGLGMIAMTRTDTSHSVLIAYTTPLWTVALSWAAFRARPSRWQALALVTGLAGVALICSPLETDWTAPGAVMGAGFLVTAAIAWSAVILHVRRHRWVSAPLTLAPWQMLLATVPLAVLAATVEGAPHGIGWDLRLVEMLVFIGPVATSACFVISAEHGRRISTFALSNFTLGVPLIGIAGSVLFLSNRLSVVYLTGLALVFAGMVLATASQDRGKA
ncbi:MAG: DMT family transporter [Pseudomonadota bacterium]|nr:DMT family transporter [Pseudomonadota bacterium]MEE3101599.1 DMT family transporter [Pseudomonadota bacterium]